MVVAILYFNMAISLYFSFSPFSYLCKNTPTPPFKEIWMVGAGMIRMNSPNMNVLWNSAHLVAWKRHNNFKHTSCNNQNVTPVLKCGFSLEAMLAWRHWWGSDCMEFFFCIHIGQHILVLLLLTKSCPKKKDFRYLQAWHNVCSSSSNHPDSP